MISGAVGRRIEPKAITTRSVQSGCQSNKYSASVLTQYRELVKSAPEELNVWAIMRKAPPLPFLPENVHGKEVVVLVTFYTGDIAQGRKLIEPLLSFGVPYSEHIGAQPTRNGRKLLILCLRLERETTGNLIISQNSAMARWTR